VITQREDEKEDLADEVEALRLDIEEMQRCRDADSIQRSQSSAPGGEGEARCCGGQFEIGRGYDRAVEERQRG
jgi:hypothetical protein